LLICGASVAQSSEQVPFIFEIVGSIVASATPWNRTHDRCEKGQSTPYRTSWGCSPRIPVSSHWECWQWWLGLTPKLASAPNWPFCAHWEAPLESIRLDNVELRPSECSLYKLSAASKDDWHTQTGFVAVFETLESL
jgi:hypothetical protein